MTSIPIRGRRLAEMSPILDALGTSHDFDRSPSRIVSLVPSITETLFALGLDAEIAGITEFCVHPAERVRSKVCVGGTKNPSLDAILALEPDLVIANKEENRRRDVERLEAAGAKVFVTYARTLAEAVEDIRTLGEVTGTGPVAEEIATRVERARAAIAPRQEEDRVAALIGTRPYMAVGEDTFAHDLMRVCGGVNCFAGRERYPRIDERTLVDSAPDVILLPTEPYSFGKDDRNELLQLDCPAARSGRIHVIEGELLSWYGPRMERALQSLSRLISGA